jgi:hypothetical protein
MHYDVDEYRVQRSDVKWGSGQGHYVLAKTEMEAKKHVADVLNLSVKDLVAMRWKIGKQGFCLSPEAKKHLGLK